MAASFTCGIGSEFTPPTHTIPVDHITAAALHAAYNLAIEVSCSPRALAVCAPALQKSVANYTPGLVMPTLCIPSDAVVPPAAASAISAWYRTRPLNVVVDLSGPNKYGPGVEEYDSSTLYISGEIVGGLVASYELKEDNPSLWRRHLLFSAIAMAHEMFRQLRFLTHRAIVPTVLAKYDSSELWSYTSGHHSPPVQIKDTRHNPGHAGWWWEDKTLGGSLEGLVYDSKDLPPYQRMKRPISAERGVFPEVPVKFIRALAVRSGIIPGHWGELSQDTVDALCDGM
ncbi:hypothetical protein C0995_000526 [Termitomyces sp. Mi166|nr:hypothetical protein C0995_000526 [Termitomyces sp. Mi166\